MAFLARALGEEGSPDAESSFADVDDDDWYLPYLARLAELGVAEADPDGAFRPLDPLTRADMAVFLTRAFAHITAVAEPAGVFDDVPADASYAGEVEAILSAGVTRGCSNQPMLYCPDNTVTRAQMASFLAQALEGARMGPSPAPVLAIRPPGLGLSDVVEVGDGHFRRPCGRVRCGCRAMRSDR